jgi:hypothetical protein
MHHSMGSLTGEQVVLPEEIQRRLNVWRSVGALALCALWAWFGFVKEAEVPILQYLDIAVHEVGHMIFRPFGEFTMLIMGSGTEVLFPFVVGLVFLVWKRDLIATGICWAWSASAAADASRYIADATQGSLALLGGGPDAMGDWERVLGLEHLDKLALADDYAARVRTVGLLLVVVAFSLVVAGIVWNQRKAHALDPTRRVPVAPRMHVPVRAKPMKPVQPVAPEDMWR